MDEKSVAIETAIQAGEIIRAAWNAKTTEVYEKGSVFNPVTEIDKACENLIKKRLKSSFNDYGVLSEESDEIIAEKGDRWIIDPLDGTTNFIRRYPFVAVSIGLEIDGQLALGIVYNPILNELFVGERGGGATLNSRPIHASKTDELGPSLLATGFPYDAWESSDNNNKEWSRFIRLTRSLRCDGSSALDLCRVANGQLDGYWEKGIYPWDIAAGIIIAKEAGCIVSDYDGGNNYLAKGEIIAANPKMHTLMLNVLKQGTEFTMQ